MTPQTSEPGKQDQPQEEPVHVSATKARQGVRAIWVVRVLVLSTIAACIALGVFLFAPPR